MLLFGSHQNALLGRWQIPWMAPPDIEFGTERGHYDDYQIVTSLFPTVTQKTMPINADEYKLIGRAAAGAVAIVSGYEIATERVIALTVSSFVTLSFDPPLVMFAIQHDADSYTSMVESKSFGVSLLSDAQVDVAKRFARKGPDKTNQFQFELGSYVNVPLVPNALAQIQCHTEQIFISGDHAIVVGLIQAVRTQPGQPLLYFARQYGSFCAMKET